MQGEYVVVERERGGGSMRVCRGLLWGSRGPVHAVRSEQVLRRGQCRCDVHGEFGVGGGEQERRVVRVRAGLLLRCDSELV